MTRLRAALPQLPSEADGCRAPAWTWLSTARHRPAAATRLSTHESKIAAGDGAGLGLLLRLLLGLLVGLCCSLTRHQRPARRQWGLPRKQVGNRAGLAWTWRARAGGGGVHRAGLAVPAQGCPCGTSAGRTALGERGFLAELLRPAGLSRGIFYLRGTAESVRLFQRTGL